MHAKFTSLGLGLGAAALALLLNQPAHAQSTVVVAPARPESTATIPNRALLGTGVGALVVGYVPALVVAATSDHKGDDKFYIPVVGPWLNLGERGCDNAFDTHCGTSTLEGIAIVADGVVQGLGAIDIVASFLIPERTYVAQTPQRRHVSFAPSSLGGRGYGVAAAGQF